MRGKAAMTCWASVCLVLLAGVVVASAEAMYAMEIPPRLHTERMATGEAYNKLGPVCSSSVHDIGTVLRVENTVNRQWTLCRVIDQGDRIRTGTVFVSTWVADRIGMGDQEFIPVEIEVRR